MGDEAPFHPSDHPLEELELAGGLIASNQDLFALIVQRLKGVAELFFKVESVLQKLDIVDEEDVEVAVKSFHLVDRFIAEMIDDVVDERFGGNRLNAHLLMVFADVMADAVEEMCFPQADAAVDEEGVVRFTRPGSDSQSGRFHKLVGGPFDKILKNVEFWSKYCKV